MANPLKGKLFLIYFLLLLASPPLSRVLVSCDSVPIQDESVHEFDQEPETKTKTSLDPQQVLLQRLDEIVKNLSEIVTRLESKLSDSPQRERSDEDNRAIEALKWDLLEKEKIDQRKRKYESKGSIKEVDEEGQIRDGEKSRAVSVTKYSPFWSERFQFVSAVKLDSQATCISVLPFRDYEGLSKYVAVGDERGTVYVFLRNGDVVVQHHTLSDSPITAMVSYMSFYKNESFVVTGHKNGAILIHRIWEGSSGEDWSLLYMENTGRFVSSNNGGDGLSITILEVHHAGRMKYILATDVSGKIWVFKENGTFHGSAKPNSRPLVFLKQRLLFLTESGAGSLDLRSMKIRESECEGLNHSLARNYVFDTMERSKAYGFTSDGDLIHVLLDIMNFKCRVRSKRKFDMDEPLAFQAIKGYLLIVSEEKIFVYNVSSQHYVRVGAPRILFSAGLDEIRSSFLNYQTVDSYAERKAVIPLIASDREKFVVIGLGAGYVGMYRSNLPVYKGEFNTIFWTSPVLFFILFLFGAWQFFAKKKEALTSWGPDDPFSSTSTAAGATTGAPLGATSSGDRGDRSFIDSSSRNPDMMDLRGSGLRGPARRYVSPPRYSGGATTSFRPASVDHNSRAASVDPNFRTSELKYRGSGLESSGFPKRRESLFINNQGVDDSN
ncbi:Guanine nucleotide-binding protein, beta subunit [Parasponia andersonii]|uniref:Guanine nucleotide-binding protein, beta subunit n=1 Tax=Parasponia andersonii TaxID=3476 RepID=A0A2P5AV78_PARAD|nr:Guanine nucleotide-binding protein, beta subunit [Parasponia andersonii]